MSYSFPREVVTQNERTPTKTGLSAEELEKRCGTCLITNPLACREVCDLWKLKQEYLALRKELPERPNASTVMATVTNETNLKILRLLGRSPSDAESLLAKLKVGGGSAAVYMGLDRVLKSLVEAGLVRVEGETYRLTTAGQKTLDSLEQYPSLGLEKIDALSEKVLRLLAHDVKTFDELAEEIPRRELVRALNYLRVHGVVAKTSGRNQVIYFATKRRPTRRLAPTEFAVFKSLPKQGTSAQELSKKLGLTLPSVYRYLRLLRYKRHVTRRKQAMTFELTPIGYQIAEALEKVAKVVEGLSPSDFA